MTGENETCSYLASKAGSSTRAYRVVVFVNLLILAEPLRFGRIARVTTDREKKMKDLPEEEEEEAPECDCCHAGGVALKTYDLRRPLIRTDPNRLKLLCKLCAGTKTSSYCLQYPGQHDSDSVEVMRTLCYVGNQILKAVHAAAAKPKGDTLR